MPKEITKKMLEEVYGNLFKAPIDNKRRVTVYCWQGGYDLFCKLIEQEFNELKDRENRNAGK